MIFHVKHAGWIKLGGAIVLGIGFAFGARALYARQGKISRPFVVIESLLMHTSN